MKTTESLSEKVWYKNVPFYISGDYNRYDECLEDYTISMEDYDVTEGLLCVTAEDFIVTRAIDIHTHPGY